MNKKSIGIIGHTPLNFMVEVANELVHKGHEVVVYSALETTFPPNKEIYFKTETIEELSYSTTKKILAAFWGFFILNARIVTAIRKNQIKSLKEVFQFSYLYKYRDKFSKHDVFNLQQVELPSFYLSFLKKDAKVVCSFWGSDVLRKENPSFFFHKVNWVENSDKITMSSQKMEDIFESKYGKGFKDKVKKVLYLPNMQLIDIIDKVSDINQKYINIQIGYNGFESQNHKKILEQIDKLPASLKSKVKITLLMHYGGSEKYIESIANYLSTLGVAEYETITDKLSLEDLAIVRKKTDILVLLPISDAFSASVYECVYAGAFLLCGDWLPYQRYSDNHIYYETIHEFEDLPDRLGTVLNGYDGIVNKTKTNSNNVLKMLDHSGNLKSWVEILESN